MIQSSALPRVMLTAVLIAAAACAPAPRQRPVKMGPVNQGAGSLTEARKYLEGRWALESFEIYLTLTTKDDAGNPLSVGRWRKTP